jgi:hypothetical protein
MKTLHELKQNFSDNEIKLLVDIVKGKIDIDILYSEILDFYSDHSDLTELVEDTVEDTEIKTFLLSQLEFDLDFWGLV